MDKYFEATPTLTFNESSRLSQESDMLLARLPAPEPLNSFTHGELLSAKRSLENNIARHSAQFPELKNSISKAGDALIDGDLSALQHVFGRALSPTASETLAQELDRNLSLLGVRVILSQHCSETTLDILRIGDSDYLSIPLTQSHIPSARGPVSYGQGEDFLLGDQIRGGASSAQKQLERIRRTIIAWQAL